MADKPLEIPGSQPTGLLAQRSLPRVSKQQARSAFWRMLGLVWPHRFAMTWGMVLGLGVALTYAASLGAILPVLKVVVDKQSMHALLLEKATAAQTGHKWYAFAAPWLTTVANWFPASDTVPDRMTTLLILLSGVIGLTLIGNILRVASQYLVLYASNRSAMDLRRDMYRKALHIPPAELTGDVSNRVSQIMSDVREVYMGIVTLFGKVAREPLKAICVLAVAVVIDLRLTLVVLAIAPVATGLLWYFGRQVRKAVVKLLQGYGVMLRGLEESLMGIDVVKGYAREGHERRRMWQLEREMLKQQNKLAWIEAFSSPLIEVTGVLIAAAGIVWLAHRTFSGEIDTSQFAVMVILLSAMLDPIRKIANVYNMVQRSGAASTRIFQFLDQPEEVSPKKAQTLAPLVREPLARESLLESTGREVRFENLLFRYNPDAPPALSDVSLRVRPGECIALVGPNGSGKSTLLKLLPRLLDAQQGRITIDQIDIRDLSLRKLRQEIAVVTQRPVIFARSVRENIAYGHEKATVDEVRDAARKAFAAEFIEAWPQQYETEMGEFGTSVSGGQRQRIAIARAFLKPASILVFDEATSEIDADSEHKIHMALNELRRGKTTFLIAHRHTVMDMADRIVVMDAGRIVDAGTHAELIDRCPLYVALYRSPSA
jgi:subfamily B ATP-binding cassette protein MsbA